MPVIVCFSASNIFKEKNQTITSSSFSYQVENYIGFNECENISQNEKESYEQIETLGNIYLFLLCYW